MWSWQRGSDFTYLEALSVLEPRRRSGIKPDMSRITAIVDLLNHPEQTYPTVHIAGTNGKSTTTRMIAAILAAHGLRAGAFTSPHLQSIRERYLLAGPRDEVTADGIVAEYISKEEFASVMTYLLPYIDLVERDAGESCTYFEVCTAIAFEWMAQSSVSAGVFEAGLGGLWDSTNVILSEVAALTHVAVDHVEFLGSTPIENARDKVGIIKPGSAVVSAEQDSDVEILLEETTLERGAELSVLGRDFAVARDAPGALGREIDVEGVRGFYQDLFVPLYGRHQSANSAMAIAVCEQFFTRALDADLVRAGLASVTSPGRLEVARRVPLVVLDGAHNPHGASMLGPALVETFGERRRIFVVGLTRKKDTEGILSEMLPYADRIIFTQYEQKGEATSGGEDPENLAASRAARDRKSEIIPALSEAVDAAIAYAGEEDLVVITGSLYTAGEARDHLLGSLD